MYILEEYHYDYHEFNCVIAMSLDKNLLIKCAKELPNYIEGVKICLTAPQHCKQAADERRHYWIRKIPIIK